MSRDGRVGRRSFLAGSAVSATALVSGCGFGSRGRGDGLVFAVFPGNEKVVGVLAEEYTRQSSVPVTVNVLPRNGYREAITGPLTAESDSFDVIAIENTWLAEFAAAGWLAPLDDLLAAADVARAAGDLFPTAYNGCRYEGRLWGLPWELSTWFLYYRTDWLDRPPATTDEYLELAKRFTRSHRQDSPTKYGTFLQGSQERVNTQDWYNFCWSAGGELFDDDLNPTFDDELAVETLRWRYAQRLVHDVVPPDVSSFGFPECLTALQQGQAAFGLQWNAAFGLLKDPKQSPQVAGKIEAAPIPTSSFGSGGGRVPFTKFWLLGVNPFSKNATSAAELVRFCTGTEAGIRSLELGGPTSSRRAWLDPAVRKTRGDASLAVDAFDNGKILPTLPEMSAIEIQLNRALSLVLAGEQPAEAALGDAADVARRRLVRAGRLR